MSPITAAGPGDWGLFGPDSVSWKVHRSPGLLCGGIRALIVQSFHPHAMAGVDQHSDYLAHPLKRLKRTAEYVNVVVFGDTASAHEAAERVKRLHIKVKGIDPVTGDAYSATDPETLLWVHCAEIHSFLASFRAYGGKLTDEEQDLYLAEQVRTAGLLDIPAEMVPGSRAEMREYFGRMRPLMTTSEASMQAIRLVTNPPLRGELIPLQAPLRVLANAAIAITPKFMREMAGLDRSRARTAPAGAVTVAADRVLRLPGFRMAPALAVGQRTLQVGAEALKAGDSRKRAPARLTV